MFVTGRVPDVRPYIAHATACVAPMRIARGIQNKVLEAMAMARPVVLTAGALEGIEADPVEETILADTAEAFAAACCRMATTARGQLQSVRRRAFVSCVIMTGTPLCARFDDILRPARPAPREPV